MPSDLPITHQDWVFTVNLRPCTCGLLAHILDSSIPFVWIRRHWPHPAIQWWRAPLPLSAAGRPHDVEVRSLEFELQLPTERFLELLPEFEDHGIHLCQMTRAVPDSLTLHNVPDAAATRILIQNGLHLQFFLPHADEYAQLASPHRDVLERALRQPKVGELAYGAR